MWECAEWGRVSDDQGMRWVTGVDICVSFIQIGDEQLPTSLRVISIALIVSKKIVQFKLDPSNRFNLNRTNFFGPLRHTTTLNFKV